jgi:hypothetical protein
LGRRFRVSLGDSRSPYQIAGKRIVRTFRVGIGTKVGPSYSEITLILRCIGKKRGEVFLSRVFQTLGQRDDSEIPLDIRRKIREGMIGLHDETILCVGPKMARVQLRAAIPMF